MRLLSTQLKVMMNSDVKEMVQSTDSRIRRGVALSICTGIPVDVIEHKIGHDDMSSACESIYDKKERRDILKIRDSFNSNGVFFV